MPVFVQTPTTAAEVFTGTIDGVSSTGIITVDRQEMKQVLMTFKGQLSTTSTVRIYGSNYNDPTMADAVLLKDIAMGIGSVTRVTAGFQADALYQFYRVSVEPSSAPVTGTMTTTIAVIENN